MKSIILREGQMRLLFEFNYSSLQDYDFSDWLKIGKIGKKITEKTKYDVETSFLITTPCEPYYEYDIFGNPDDPQQYAIMRGQDKGNGKAFTVGDLGYYERNNIEIFPEYVDTEYSVPFLGRRTEEDVKKHNEFMEKLDVRDGKVLLKHYSNVRINDGVLSVGHPKQNYSNNNDIGWYSWASKGIGNDPSNSGRYVYCAYVNVDEIYDYQNDLERTRRLMQAVNKKPYVAMYWGDNKNVIAVTSIKATPIDYIKDNSSGKIYDAEWNEI